LALHLCSSQPVPATAPASLPLHDALPICDANRRRLHTGSWRISQRGAKLKQLRPFPRVFRAGYLPVGVVDERVGAVSHNPAFGEDRKSTRLNSSHDQTSYAVFCLKKKTYD